jgi:hypothetical protein
MSHIVTLFTIGTLNGMTLQHALKSPWVKIHVLRRPDGSDDLSTRLCSPASQCVSKEEASQ